MAISIDKMIRRYGTPMTLVHDGGETAIRAFLQETASRSEGGTQWEVTPIGELSKGVYVYIGPAVPEAMAGDDIRCCDATYQMRRAHLVFVADKPQYCWGICVEKGGERKWGE